MPSGPAALRVSPYLKENTSKINCSMLFKEIIAVYSENHTKPINTLCRQNAELYIVAGCIYSYHWSLKGFVVSLSARHGASSGYGWRRSPGMECSCSVL
jgi:hypothetical protein